MNLIVVNWRPTKIWLLPITKNLKKNSKVIGNVTATGGLTIKALTSKVFMWTRRRNFKMIAKWHLEWIHANNG